MTPSLPYGSPILWSSSLTTMHRIRHLQRAVCSYRTLLPGKERDPGRTAANNRLFSGCSIRIDAVRWGARTGAPWPDLPERFGLFNSVLRRFNRWSKKGLSLMRPQRIRLHAELQHPEWLMLESTTVRAHQHTAGALKAPGYAGRGGGS